MPALRFKLAGPQLICGLILHDVALTLVGPVLLCDVSIGRLCPVLPLDTPSLIFHLLHSLSHPGVWVTESGG